MKALAGNTLLIIATAGILYLFINWNDGALLKNPVATLGAGLIGFGLCMNSRKRLSPAVVKCQTPAASVSPQQRSDL